MLFNVDGHVILYRLCICYRLFFASSTHLLTRRVCTRSEDVS